MSPVTVETHCPYCSLQCGMSLIPANGTLEVGARDFPTNRGGLCQKGWTAAHLLSPGERLTTPLMRESRDEPLLPVGWDEALDRVAAEVRRAQAAHGSGTGGLVGGRGLTHGEAYR